MSKHTKKKSRKLYALLLAGMMLLVAIPTFVFAAPGGRVLGAITLPQTAGENTTVQSKPAEANKVSVQSMSTRSVSALGASLYPDTNTAIPDISTGAQTKMFSINEGTSYNTSGSVYNGLSDDEGLSSFVVTVSGANFYNALSELEASGVDYTISSVTVGSAQTNGGSLTPYGRLSFATTANPSSYTVHEDDIFILTTAKTVDLSGKNAKAFKVEYASDNGNFDNGINEQFVAGAITFTLSIPQRASGDPIDFATLSGDIAMTPKTSAASNTDLEADVHIAVADSIYAFNAQNLTIYSSAAKLGNLFGAKQSVTMTLNNGAGAEYPVLYDANNAMIFNSMELIDHGLEFRKAGGAVEVSDTINYTYSAIRPGTATTADGKDVYIQLHTSNQIQPSSYTAGPIKKAGEAFENLTDVKTYKLAYGHMDGSTFVPGVGKTFKANTVKVDVDIARRSYLASRDVMADFNHTAKLSYTYARDSKDNSSDTAASKVVNFETAAPAVKTSMQVDGIVWLDTDEDGKHGSGEEGIKDVTVKLRNAADDSEVASTTTDASGAYDFSGLSSTVYYDDDTAASTETKYYIEVLMPTNNQVTTPWANTGIRDTDSSVYQAGNTVRTGTFSLIDRKTYNASAADEVRFFTDIDGNLSPAVDVADTSVFKAGLLDRTLITAVTISGVSSSGAYIDKSDNPTALTLTAEYTPANAQNVSYVWTINGETKSTNKTLTIDPADYPTGTNEVRVNVSNYTSGAIGSTTYVVFVDKSGLRTLLHAAEERVQSKYTEASWDTLASAMAEAEKILAAASYPQSDITTATTALQSALDALVLKDGESEEILSLDEIIAQLQALDVDDIKTYGDADRVAKLINSYDNLSSTEKESISEELQKKAEDARDKIAKINHDADKVSVNGNDVPWFVRLSVETVALSDSRFSSFKTAISPRTLYALYDLKLTNTLTGASYPVPSGRNVRTTIDFTRSANLAYSVGHRATGGTTVNYINLTASTNTTVSFSTSSFSEFGIVSGTATSSGSTNPTVPRTGDEAAQAVIYLFIMLVGSLCAIGIMLYRNKKKCNQ